MESQELAILTDRGVRRRIRGLRVLKCAECGAALPSGSGTAITCTYCGAVNQKDPPDRTTSAPEAEVSRPAAAAVSRPAAAEVSQPAASVERDRPAAPRASPA